MSDVLPTSFRAIAEEMCVFDPDLEWRQFLVRNGNAAPVLNAELRWTRWLQTARKKAPATAAPALPKPWKAPEHWATAREPDDDGTTSQQRGLRACEEIVANLDKLGAKPLASTRSRRPTADDPLCACGRLLAFDAAKGATCGQCVRTMAV